MVDSLVMQQKRYTKTQTRLRPVYEAAVQKLSDVRGDAAAAAGKGITQR